MNFSMPAILIDLFIILLCFLAARSGQLYFSFYFALTNISCAVVGICSAKMEYNGCSLQYGTDPSYSNLGPPIQGPINSPFKSVMLESSTTYYYLVAVAVESNFNVTIQGIQVVGSCDVDLNTLSLVRPGILRWNPSIEATIREGK